MGMRYQPQGLTRINQASPLANGLAFAYILGTSANGDGESVPYLAGTPVALPIGTAVKASSSTGRIFSTGPNDIKTNTYSLFAVGASTAGVTAQSAIDDDAPGVRRFQFRIANGKVDFIPFNTGSGVAVQVAASAVMTSAEMARGFTMGATCSPTAAAVFQNGVKTAGGAISGTVVGPTGDFWIGCRKTTSTAANAIAWLTGGLSLVAGWSRTLSDEEMLSLSSNPWQLFADPEEDDDYIAAAGPANTDGALNATLGDAILSASGSPINAGQFSATMGNASMSASGAASSQPSGSFSTSLSGVSFSATGALLASGSLSAVMDGAQASMVGNVAQSAGGTFASTLGGAAMNAYGYEGDAPPPVANKRYRPRILRRHFTN